MMFKALFHQGTCILLMTGKIHLSNLGMSEWDVGVIGRFGFKLKLFLALWH